MSSPPKRTKSRFRTTLERASNQATRLIGARWGHVWPQYYVCEYPRSGGTWLAKMLADYFGISKPGASVFPIGCRAVVHNHWKFHPKLRNVFYLARDGRDVLVSLYFYRMRSLQQKHTWRDEDLMEEYENLLGEGFDPENSLTHMARFIEREFARPYGSRLNWTQHVNTWYDPVKRPYIAYLKYEELLADGVGTLKRAVEHVTGRPADERKLRHTVEHFSMAGMTGRAPGTEDRSSFIRKGVAGDWLNHFTRETAELFDRLAGDALVRAGYEKDRDWVGKYEYAKPK